MDIKQLKNLFLDILEDAGIPEANVSIRIPKYSKPNIIGWYRKMSQYNSMPIIYIDITQHTQILIDNDDLSSYTLSKNSIDTLLYSYGSMIYESIIMEAKRSNNFIFVNKIKKIFNKENDFSESFIKYINKDSFINDTESLMIEESIESYKNSTFTPESLCWVKQPKWKREIDHFIQTNKKFLKCCYTPYDAFKNDKYICELTEQLLSDTIHVNILKCEGYQATLNNAYNELTTPQKIIHYVLEINQDVIIDLTAKQFNSNHDVPTIISKQQLEKEWKSITTFKHRQNNKFEQSTTFKKKSVI